MFDISLENNHSLPRKRELSKLKQKYVEKILNQKSSIEYDIPEKRIHYIDGTKVIDCSNSPSLIKKRRLATEETYEHWHQNLKLNKNINKYLDYQENNHHGNRRNDSNSVDDQNDEDQGNLELEDRSIEDELRQSRMAVKVQFSIESSGFEVLPNLKDAQNNDPLVSAPLPYFKRHIVTVFKLLFLNLMRKNWKIAYKCYSLLLRMNQVDVRAIWPIGLEILQRRAEEEIKLKQPEDIVNDYDLRSFKIPGSNSNLKDEQFSNWLQTFYPINKTINPKLNYIEPLPYRIGTRETSPLFVTNNIWVLIMKKKFDLANEKLSELLLTQPYINDGLIYFLQGLSYYYEAIMLSDSHSEESIDISNVNRIEKLMFDSNAFFEKAKERDFIIPEKIFNNEISLIKSRIAEDSLVKDDSSFESGN
ncbi:hypothetical protein WICMUC_002560 [Wickerhamomyces mucosus]|uniref:RNA polymerase I-specific transcription initiation factor RRN11 n=1 Tax=Wickerhamomyces mucosus TaxID=1378264 RepID=A0A9P8PNS3_9ASCO|nr:hypothetical protein WICMUC_002560 [Wickerhamomyces mucosus]